MPEELFEVIPRRRAGLWVVVVGFLSGCFALVIVALLAVLVLPELSHRARSSCLANSKQLAIGLMMYVQDYDNRFPPASTWQPDLYPYTKNVQLFVCPDRPRLPVGYAFNSALSGRAIDSLSSPG